MTKRDRAIEAAAREHFCRIFEKMNVSREAAALRWRSYTAAQKAISLADMTAAITEYERVMGETEEGA